MMKLFHPDGRGLFQDDPAHVPGHVGSVNGLSVKLMYI